MRLVNLFAGIILTLLLQARTTYAGDDDCSWTTSTKSKKYDFNLLTSDGHPHGARSEDGFYTVSEKGADGSDNTFWFQPCEHMQFNYGAPKCDHCESCGGPLHCGETCSALLSSTSDGGYPHCTTLGAASNTSFSLIDSDKPQLGVAIKMVAAGPEKSCSLLVAIYCSSKTQELPEAVTKDGQNSCDYETSFYHSAGCPNVTNRKGGGMGWFGTLVIVLLCLFVVYIAVGIGYRVAVLGKSGLEAIPNLDFWKRLPHTIQLAVEAVISFFMSCYRRCTEPTYTLVND